MEEFSWTKELIKKRRSRAVVMAWLLAGFSFLLVFITIARIGGNIAKHPQIGVSQPIVKEID